MTDTTDHPSRRAGLRDELVKALGRIKTCPPVAHCREQADHVLAVLYREWPWLRAEAEDAAAVSVPAADRAALSARIAAAVQPLLMDTLPKPIAAARADEVADAVLSVLPAPADRAAEGLAKHVVRAIFALKSPTPPGSEHYRAGWDDGVEAAMDAARDAVLHRLATEAAAPVVGVAADTTPDETLCRCGHGKAYHDAKYADPQCRLCPEDGERMWRHAYTPVVPARPGNDTKTTEDRPRCPDCRAKGHAVGAADKTPVVAYRSHSGSLLRCLTHAPDQTALDGGAFHPVTAGDLPDGGVCTYRAPGVECGADVLNPQKP